MPKASRAGSKDRAARTGRGAQLPSPQRPGPVRRFTAILGKQGPNYCVDVPKDISRDFSAWSRAGRIAVEGSANGVQVRATLIPAGAGKHRLFLQSGTRNAAGIAAGARVALRLRAVAPEDVRPPRDVASALRKTAGAQAAFAVLPASHRRELLRHVDAALTPAQRQQRIAETVDHVLGRQPARKRRTTLAPKPLWTCPRCGNEFVNRNQYHSCRRYEIATAFAGKPDFVRELYDRLQAMVERFGEVKVQPYRDKVSFMVRVRFAGAVPRKGWLDVVFWSTRRIDDPRFHRIETLTPDVHLHMLRVTEPAQFDEQLESWLRESYAIGRQEHLR